MWHWRWEWSGRCDKSIISAIGDYNIVMVDVKLVVLACVGDVVMVDVLTVVAGDACAAVAYVDVAARCSKMSKLLMWNTAMSM